MAGTGSVYVAAVRAVGDIQSTHQYDVDVRFDIAFDWGGWNDEGAYYEIRCDGQVSSGWTTFSVGSGGGNWVWTNIGGTKTFRVAMPTSGSGRTVGISAVINTGISPSSISADGSRWLDAVTWQWSVGYNANGGSGAPGAQTKVYGQTLKLSSTAPTRSGYTFKGWATSSNGSVAYSAGGNYTANSGATLYAVWALNAPSAPTGCAVTRNSDNKNTVSWTRGSNADVLYADQKVERSVDGCSWSEIATVSKTATSYADTTTSANHSYAYRVRSHNATAYSAYSTSGTVYNTPCAPGTPTVARTGDTSVSIKLANTANTATSLELQRCTDKANAATVVDLNAINGKVTSASDNPGGGTFYYRARNARGTLKSAWSAWSDAVVTICAPMAPTLKEPASSMVVSKAEQTIVFSWAHNPIDGSAQTAAQLRYSTDGGANWTTVGTTTAQSYSLANSFAVNATVTWGVRTKGAHADYGPWSGNRTFSVYQVPTVGFVAPTDGYVVENVPIHVRIAYSDQSGTLADASFSIRKGDATLYERQLGTVLEFDVAAADFLPTDGDAYTLVVNARSSSTLTAQASTEVSVSFVLPLGGTLVITPDRETGHVGLLVGTEPDAEREDAVSISVYRVANGVRKLLAEGLSEGYALVDENAPTNTDMAYEVVTFAASGAAATVSFPAILETPWYFFYYGDAMARCMWNVEEQISAKRPSKVRRLYAGRAYPVSYDSAHLSDERTVDAVLMTLEEASAFRRLMEHGGRCVYKGGDGDVFRADAEVSLSPVYTTDSYYGGVSVGLVRIDGEPL